MRASSANAFSLDAGPHPNLMDKCGQERGAQPWKGNIEVSGTCTRGSSVPWVVPQRQLRSTLRSALGTCGRAPIRRWMGDGGRGMEDERGLIDQLGGAVTAGAGFPFPSMFIIIPCPSISPSYHVLCTKYYCGLVWAASCPISSRQPLYSPASPSFGSLAIRLTNLQSSDSLWLLFSQFFIVAFVLGQHQSGWGPALIVLDFFVFFLFSFSFFLFCPYYSIEISSVLARTT